MTQNVKSKTDLITETPDNTSGEITPQDIRDAIVSAVNLLPVASTDNQIQAVAPSVIPLIVQGASGQTADLLETQDVNGIVLTKVDHTGTITCANLNTGAISCTSLSTGAGSFGSAAFVDASTFDPAGAATAAQASSCQKSQNLVDVTSTATALNNLGGCPSARNINTTAPLAGGGSLSSDLTITIAAATDSTAGSLSGPDKTKIDSYPSTPAGLSLSTGQISGLGSAALLPSSAVVQAANNGSDFASAATTLSTLGAVPLSSANQPNGYVGLDSSSVANVIFIPRYDTAANLATIIPLAGELMLTSDTHQLFAGDGVTVGGIPLTSELTTASSIGVKPGANIANNGTALVAAIVAASILTPYGNALSSTNRALVLLQPGVYDLTGAAAIANLNTAYVDLVGLGGSEAVIIITSSTYYLELSSDNVQIRGITIYSTNGGGFVHAANNSVNVVMDDVFFALGSLNPTTVNAHTAISFTVAVTTLAGYYKNCRTNGVNFFGCVGGNTSFTGGVWATFEECTVFSNSNNSCFGSGISNVYYSVFCGTISRCKLYGGKVNVRMHAGATIQNSYLNVTSGKLCVGSCSGTITNCVNNGGAFEVTTSAAHGMITGETVKMASIGGISAANYGSALITVNDTTHFTYGNSSSFPNGTITGAVNNGSGLIRITFAGGFSLLTGDNITISGVTGTTEANGTWLVTSVTGQSAQVDLQGSAFTNTYTGGGTLTSVYISGGTFTGAPLRVYQNVIIPNSTSYALEHNTSDSGPQVNAAGNLFGGATGGINGSVTNNISTTGNIYDAGII